MTPEAQTLEELTETAYSVCACGHYKTDHHEHAYDCAHHRSCGCGLYVNCLDARAFKGRSES